MTSKEHKSVAAKASNRQASISRRTVAAIPAVAARAAGSVATIAARSGRFSFVFYFKPGITTEAAFHFLIQHHAAMAASAAVAAIAPVTAKRRSAVTALRDTIID